MSLKKALIEAATSSVVDQTISKVADVLSNQNWPSNQKKRFRKAMTGSTNAQSRIGISPAMFSSKQISHGEEQCALPESEAEAVLYLFQFFTNMDLNPFRQGSVIYDSVFHIGGPLHSSQLRILLKKHFPGIIIYLHPDRIPKSPTDSLFRKTNLSEGIRINDTNIRFDGEYMAFGHVFQGGKHSYFLFGKTHHGTSAGTLAFMSDKILHQYIFDNENSTYFLVFPVNKTDNDYIADIGHKTELFHS